jgi:PPOX class probable F420-dependent enzyme
VSRRDEIRMSEAELGEFLHEQRTVICATIGRDGWPHLMPLWYVVREHPPPGAGDELWVWTYAASQKVRNLERDRRATLTIEAGETYDELRGVMFRTEAVIERDPDFVAALGFALYERYLETDELPAEVRASIAKQAPKRVAIRFVEASRVSWDHRKLVAAR